MNQLYKLEEFTIDDFRKYVSAKTKFFQKDRKAVRGNEAKIAKIIDFDFNRNILTIQTDPTYDFRAWNLNDGATGQIGAPPKAYARKQGRYLIQIEIVDLEKWKDSPWLEMKLPEFKEILRLADIRLNCTCMAFFWQGHRYELTQLDSAIYPYSGADGGYWRNNKDDFNGHNKQAGLCKHLAAVMPMLNFQAPAILKAIRESAKKKKLVEK